MKYEIKQLLNKIISYFKKEQNIYKWHCGSSPAQYRLPIIKIVGIADKECIDEAHDAVVSFLVDKFFKDYDCHVFKYKGQTYMRVKNKDVHTKIEKVLDDVDVVKPGFTTGLPYINIHEPHSDAHVVYFGYDDIAANRYSRYNAIRYKKKGK